MINQKGETWELVFSDEFNTPGRTFWPGGASFISFSLLTTAFIVVRLVPSSADDPYWEAQDLHSWGT